MTQAWQRHFVRLEVPTGATVTVSGTARARSYGAVGFLAYYGLTTVQNPGGSVVDRGWIGQFGDGTGRPVWQTHALRSFSWTNNTQNTEFLGWAAAEDYFEYPIERFIPTIEYTISTQGSTCSSLPSEEVIADQLGNTRHGGYSADPVNTGTGNFTLSEVDLSVVGGAGFSRSYNSMDDHVAADPNTGKPGLLGRGWTSSWDVSLRPRVPQDAGSGLDLRLGDGRRIEIPSDGDGGWAVPAHLRAEVVAGPDPELGQVRRLRHVDGRVWTFDVDGRILRMQDGGPRRVSVARNASRFPTAVVVEAFDGSSWGAGAVLSLHDDDGDGLLDRVSDPAGNQVTYTYADDRLVAVSVPHHPSEFGADGAPVAVSYVHDAAGRVVEVHRFTGEGVEPVVEVVNSYDGFGRVGSQVMPSGEVAEFGYGPLDPTTGTRTTTVTHRWPDQPGTSNEVVAYVHDEEATLIRIVDPTPQSGASDRAWEDERLLGRTTRGGANWAYAFDGAGRLVQRVVPDPRTGEVGPRDPSTGLFPPPGPGDGWSLESTEYCDAEDGDPRVRRRIDATGVVTEYRYDPGAATGDPCPEGAMIPTRVTVAPGTPDEGASSATVGADGRVRSTIDGDGVVTEWVYGDVDPACETWQLCAEVVAPGTSDEVRTEYRYDAAGRLGAVTTAASTPVAATTSYSYDAAGRVVSEVGPLVGVDPGHHPIERRYDRAGRLVCVSDQSNPTPAAACDETSGSWSYTYDEVGRVETVRDPDGVITLTEHVSVDEERVTVAHGTADAATTTHRYGPLGRLTSVTSPEGIHTSFGYDLDGNRTTTVIGPDPTDEARTVTSVFDRLGRVVERLGPVGAVDVRGGAVRSRSSMTYDRAGRVIETTDGEGDELVRTWFRHDHAGRLRFEIVDLDGDGAYHDPTSTDPAERDSADRVTEYTYTPAGRLRSVVVGPTGADEYDWVSGDQSAKRTTTYTYDHAGRVASVTAPDGGASTTAYDPAGRVERSVTPEGAVTRFDHDLAGRVTARHTPSPTGHGESVETWVHDPMGRVVAHAAPHAPGAADVPVSTFGYLPGGALVWARDPRQDRWGDRVETRFGHDQRGNLVEQRAWSNDDADDPEVWTEIIETWAYDLDDRPVAHTRPGGGTTTYGYDPTTGWLSSISQPSGRTTSIEHWPDGTVRRQSWSMPDSDPVVASRWYDSLGRQTKVTYPTGDTTYGWDRSSNLVEVDGPWGTTSFGYDQHGHRTRIGYPWGFDATYSLDPMGRAVTLTQSSVVRAAWTYDRDGRILSEVIGPDGAGGTASWQWPVNGAHHPTGYRQQLADNPLREYVLEWDHNGRLASESLNGTTDTFAYDPAGQLLSRHRGDEVWTWTYNTRGLITHTRSETTAGVEARITDFNADGQPTTATSHWTNGWVVPASYDHDPDGRLTQARLASTPVFQADYDPRGLPSETTTHWDGRPHTTRRTYDGDGYLVGLDPGTGTGTQPIAWDRTRPDGDVLATHSLGARDGLVSYLYGPTGAVGVHYGPVWLGGVNRDPRTSNLNHYFLEGYDPWGNPQGVAAPARFGLGYRGELVVDGIVHLRNRDYHPALHTFTTPDPLGGVPGTPTVSSRYHYADNNPLNRTDPLGLRPGDDEWSTPDPHAELIAAQLELWNQYYDYLEPMWIIDPTKIYDLGPVPPPGSRPRGRCGPLGWALARVTGGCELTLRNAAAEGSSILVGAAGATACTGATAISGGLLAGCYGMVGAAAGATHDLVDGDTATNPLNPTNRAIDGALAVPIFRLLKRTPIPTPNAARVVTTGQEHHVISRRIAGALDDHPTLAGQYTARDPRLVTRAVDPAAHRGYQTWHRQLDTEIVDWLARNPNATTTQFEQFLRGRYAQSDLLERFPNGF